MAMVSLSSCFDNNYDLSDIDTTSEFKVKDLVIPVNLDVITLGDIFDIKEGDQIKEVTLNGKTFYAVNEKGNFSSDRINIPSFVAPAPSISPSTLSFNTAGLSGNITSNVSLELVAGVDRTVVYKAENIDPAIVELTELYSDNLQFEINFSAEAINGAELSLSDVDLILPKGLVIKSMTPAGTYNSTTGKCSIPSLSLAGGNASIVVEASQLNVPAGSGIDYASHSLTLSENINIENAKLNVTPTGSSAALPTNLNLNLTYNVSPINVTAISGQIEYHIEGININPIELGEMPDFLAQDGTNLVLANPQIYLSLTNPLAKDGIRYQSGLTLTANRENSPAKDFSLDNGTFQVGLFPSQNDRFNFCLSPSYPENIPDGFPNLTHVAFSSLGEVLSGDGIPTSIDIRLDDPQISRQKVTKFGLNQNIEGINGSWEFLAPLALTSNGSNQSQIVYTKTVDGWNDQDVDAITIKVLELNMTVDNNLPLEANLTGYPIDVNGKQISNVEIEGAVIPGNAKDMPVKIYITGEVKHLDGIRFTANVYPTSDEALAPSQSLTLKNVKAKVTGNYIKEL